MLVTIRPVRYVEYEGYSVPLSRCFSCRVALLSRLHTFSSASTRVLLLVVWFSAEMVPVVLATLFLWCRSSVLMLARLRLPTCTKHVKQKEGRTRRQVWVVEICTSFLCSRWRFLCTIYSSVSVYLAVCTKG